MKKLLVSVLILVMAFAMASAVFALPTVEYVKINGDEFASGDTLKVVPGDALTIRVKLDADQSNDTEQNVEVQAWIVGYKHADKNQISDTTGTFDMDPGDTQYADLSLTVPDDVDKDYYDLRVFVATRTGPAADYTFPLHVKGEQSMMTIRDVVFNPEREVIAGRALLTTVRIKNVGSTKEESVKVRVLIPELGVSASDYIDSIDVDDSATSEELYIRIPESAAAGDYKVRVEVTYNDGYDKVTADKTISVAPSEGTATGPATKPTENTMLTIGPESQEVKAGQTGVVYPVTIGNLGTATKTYVVTISTTEDWAEFDVSPNNVMTVKPGETQTSYIYVSAKKEATVGTHNFRVTVKAGADVLKEVTLSANVTESGAAGAVSWDKLKRGLEIGLVVLVVLLVILGLVIGFNRLKSKEEGSEDKDSGQTYY